MVNEVGPIHSKIEPTWIAALRSQLRREHSLRRRAKSRLDDPESAWIAFVQRLGRRLWRLLARPWAIPLATTVAVVILALWRPEVSNRSVLCSIVEVLCQEESARQLLSVIWQVEAAALALTVAATLFAFESAVRQRTSLSLHDYAERAGLMQFVMLGASGLIVVGVVLAWDAGRPPVAAATFALVVAGLGIAAFPIFVRRAIDVVGPSWFRRQRLADIQSAVKSHIRSEAIELASIIELDHWLEERENCRRVAWSPEPHVALEASPQSATVYDVHLGRLDTLASERASGVFITVHAGSQTHPESTLIGTAEAEGVSTGGRPVVTLTAKPSEELLPTVVTALHEEGLEAVRTGSPSALDEVAEGYVEMLLAWPRAWAELGQQVRGGLLSALYPFRIAPLDEVQRHLWLQLEQAVDRGLREQVLTITSIPWTVARMAIPLRADDLVRKLNQLARTFVSAAQDSEDLGQLVAERAWRYHVEVCEFHAARRLRDSDDLDEQKYWADVVALFYADITELLRTFYDRGFWEQFEALDRRYQKVLQYWNPAERAYLAEALIEDPDRFDASQSDIDQARRALASNKVRENLERRRAGYRLSVLAWMLHRDSIDDEAAWSRIRTYAQALPTPTELVQSAGHALDHDGLLDRWVGSEGPELEVRSVDTEGPVLRALVLVLLLKRGALKRIPPAAWMSEHRTKRARSLVSELLDIPLVRDFALDPDTTPETAAKRVGELLHDAEQEQREIEDRELIARELDQQRVAAFKEAVVQGWSDARLAPGLLALVGAPLQLVDPGNFSGGRFGFSPRLEPKGMFVTPTNWGGVESHGEHLGRELARGEAEEVIKACVDAAKPVRGRGSALERLDTVLDQLRTDGYTPELVLMPINWRLGTELGLPEWRQPREDEGSLGHHIRGWIGGIPVIEWSTIEKDRLYALDLSAFCDVEEARVPGTTRPELPQVSLEPVDEALADEIIAHWDDLESEDEAASRRRRVLTSVRVIIGRRYRVLVRDGMAARSVWLPPSARGQ